MYICSVSITQQPVKRVFKVVLDNGAMIGVFYFTPHLLEVIIIGIQQTLYLLFVHGQGGILPYVPVTCMNIDYIRGEFLKLRVIKHYIFPVLGIFTLIEFRSYALVKQKQLKYHDYVMSCRASEYCYLLINKACPLIKELSL